MKKCFILTYLLSIAICMQSQIINVNPDPNGEPWWSGGLLLTPEALAKVEALPKLTLSEQSAKTPLPYKVDNSEKKVFQTNFLSGQTEL